jgi:hypothetical protein
VLLLLLAAALCSHQGSTLGWGDGLGPDGTRFRLAPNGISHLATDGSPLDTCHWFPLHGTDPLCQAAPGAEPRYQQLTYAYPALQGGAWLSFLAMLVTTLAGTQAATLTRVLAALATVSAAGGILLVLSSAPSAAAALASLPFGFGGPGVVLAVLGAVAALAATLLIPSPPVAE